MELHSQKVRALAPEMILLEWEWDGVQKILGNLKFW